MSVLKFSSIGGPTAVLLDVILLLLVFVLTVLLTRPVDPSFVVISDQSIPGAATSNQVPLAMITVTADGITIGDEPTVLTQDEAAARLTALAEEDGDAVVCIHGIPFEAHWAIQRLIADALARDPYFIPCKERT